MSVIDSSGFQAMVEELSKLSGKSYEHALVDQVGSILKVCLRKTPARTAREIIKRVSRQNNHVELASGHVVSFWAKADAVMFLDDTNWDQKKNPRQKAPRLKDGKSWHDMSGDRRWSSERWTRWKTLEALARRRHKDPRKAVKARGLAKQTWLQIAADLGIDIAAPAYVRNAVSPNGKTYREGSARKLLEAAAFYIEIRNSNPLMTGKLNGHRIVQSAINTRLKAFSHEMRKGVFDDVAYRAKRYPGIFTN